MGYIAKETDYWIHTSALTFTLNALDVANYIQCTVAGGAVIQCFIPDADTIGTLGYSASHGYKSWKLTAGPTAFNSDSAKYVYAAIPKDSAASAAMIVFPSEKLDINGQNEAGNQIGNTNYFYIWLQGVISAKQGNARQWNPYISTGKLDTAAGDAERAQSSVWYEYSVIADAVTLLKRLTMAATSWFTNIRLGSDKHNLTGVATALTEEDFIDSDELVATPNFIKANYLSKKNDDTAEGNITFQKDISVGGNALVNGILTVGSWLKAAWAELAYIKSPDYTGDGLGDKGFLLTNNYNGHSRLTVDELYVRMKAVFEELQIKKETVMGGNHIYSCAANIISFTRFIHQEESGGAVTETDISFQKVPMPLKVKGIPAFLVKLLQATNILSKSETVRRTYTSVSDFVRDVQRVRCYFLAKEGEQEIENWWQAHDLARCQTFNLSKKHRESYVTFESHRAENVYWWRKVVAVSSTPVEVEGKMYHWFDIAVADCDTGSDIPAAGDHVSQFGNDSDVERMNLISIETNGSEAPAVKMYEGIDRYSLTVGHYGNPLKTRLSPKAGYRFDGSKFEISTEYSIEPVPVERGSWNNIPVVDGVRTCYYYDLVQHNGASWLCVASAGNMYIVDEAFRFSKDGVVHNYYVGEEVNQNRYNEFTVAEKTKCHRSQKGSTTDEPSASSVAWRAYAQKGEKGDKGDNAVLLDIDNEHEDFLYNDTGLVSPAVGAIVTPRLYDGGVQVTESITWAVSMDDGLTWNNPDNHPIDGRDATVLLYSNGGVIVLGLNVLSAKVIIRALYKGSYYYANFTANKTMQDKYDLSLIPNAISYNPATFPANGVTITPSATHTDLQGTTENVNIRTDIEEGLVENGIYLYYGYVSSDGGIGDMTPLTTANYIATGANVSNYEGVYFELRKAVSYDEASGEWQFKTLDYDTIPFAKVQNGKDTVRLDLDNEMDSILYDGAGNKVSGNVSTTVYMYEGANDVSTDITAVRIISSENISSEQISINGHVVTVSGLAADGYVIIGATYKNKEYNAKFSVKKISGKDKFEVSVNPSAISVNSSETQADRIVEVQVFRTPANGGERELVAFTWDGAYEFVSDYNLSLGVKDTVNNPLEETTPTSRPATTRTFKFSAAQARDTYVIDITATLEQFNTTTRRWSLQDTETIPVARVANGVDGTGANAVRLDLDNEMDVIPTDAGGNVLNDVTLHTVVRLYDGATPVSLEPEDVVSVGAIVINGQPYGYQKSGSGGIGITWTIPAGVVANIDKTTSTIVVLKNNQTYTATFVVAVVKSGEPGVSPTIMKLLPSPSQVVFKRGTGDELTPVSQNITLAIQKSDKDGTSSISVAASGLTVRYSPSGAPAVASDGAAWPEGDEGITISNTANFANIYLAAFKNGALVDRETVPIMKDGTKGLPGEDAVGIVMTPPSVIVEQDINNPGNIQPIATRSLGRVAVQVMKGTALCNITSVTAAPLHVYISDKETTGCYAATRTWNPQGNVANIYIKGIGTQDSQYYNTGQITLSITYTDPDTNISKTITSVITRVYVNLVGTWAETIKGDTKTEVAQSLTHGYDPDSGNVIPLENFGEYIRSSEENISTIRKYISSYNLFTGLSDGDGWTKDTFAPTTCRFYASERVISPLTRELPAGDYVVSAYNPNEMSVVVKDENDNTIASGFAHTMSGDEFSGAGRQYFAFTLNNAARIKVEMFYYDETYYSQTIYRPQLEQGSFPSAFDASNAFSESQIKQTASEIEMRVNNTGVKINDGTIDLKAGKVNFVDPNGSPYEEPKVVIDPTTGVMRTKDMYAENGYFSGELHVNALYTKIGGFYTEDNKKWLDLSNNKGNTYILEANSAYYIPDANDYEGMTLNIWFRAGSQLIDKDAAPGAANVKGILFTCYTSSDSYYFKVGVFKSTLVDSGVQVLSLQAIKAYSYSDEIYWVVISQRGMLYIKNHPQETDRAVVLPDGTYRS